MGISSNQARFLSLTARQVDLEHRVQQICQRRLRLASELERVATDYNNSIGNRKMFTYNAANSGIDTLSINKIQSIRDTNSNNYKVLTQTGTSAYTGVAFTAGVGFNNAVTGADPAAALTALNTAMGTNYVDSAAAASAGWNLAGSTYTYAGAADMTLAALGLDSGATEADALEAAIRNGVITIAAEADQYTQTRTDVSGTDYELKDWRTLTFLADELFKGDDSDAETKYDITVSNINSQDKKLQLEQSSIEVEYKAVSSEKEAVKKILDTNASASFKYFS